MTEKDIELAEVLWSYHHLPGEPVKSDLIIGLGSYDTRVAEHCAQLLCEGWAPVILFTGAEGNFTQGKWDRSEAEVFAEVAIKAGVDAAKILIEPKATNTGENIRLSKMLCDEHGMVVESAILVSKPNMNRRGFATCLKWWPELDVICGSPDTHFLRNPAPGHTPEDIISEIVGDLQRIIEYPKMGFQAGQELPPEVLEAYGELRKRGYTSHLLEGP